MPAWFRFEQSDEDDALGSVAGAIPYFLLDLPSGPLNTAEWVAREPEQDFPQPADYFLLGAPVLAAVAGVYQRFKNLVMFKKWLALSVCAAAPTTTVPGETYCPPAGQVNGSYHLLAFVPGGMAEVHATLTAWTGGSYPLGGNPAARAQIVIMDAERPENPADGPGDGEQIAAFTLDAIGTEASITLTSGFDVVPAYVYLFAGSGPTEICYTYTWGYTPHGGAETLPVAPDVEPLPPDYPAPPPPAGCEPADICASLATLMAKVDALDARVQHIIAASYPPMPLGDTPPVLPQPVDLLLPPGTPSVPYLPIDKPLGAFGAVIQCTSVPAYVAHHGGSPGFFADLGHVAMLTEWGPLPSVLLKHNPLVLMPMPAQVTSLVLDLRAGVVAQVQWLRAPK